MLISYNWLNKYFDGKLPAPEEVAEALTFHAWEIEETREVEGDTIIDVKVLPDKSMWGLSHRGIAKDISVILDLPLSSDYLSKGVKLELQNKIKIDIQTDKCRGFAAAHIEGIKVGPSPEWLRVALESIGQRSINNIVDASNYVMFDLGQPSHTFDADLIGKEGLTVRTARAGESLVGLDEIEYHFTSEDILIARGDTDEVLSIAGLKGGQYSGIGNDTSNIIVEVASWDPVSVRKTGQRLRLRTDASTRYENGIVPEMVPYGLKAVVDLIIEVAGGKVNGTTEIIKEKTTPAKVSVSLSKINSVLGVELTKDEVTSILNRFGWDFELSDDTFIVTSPFERTDLQIAEDIIEEVGRIYGYQHIEAVTPSPFPLSEINQRFYYSETIRNTLIEKGFSEIYTSSFRDKDEVKLANAFASDKGYLRSSLILNMAEALTKNG
ncbi:MAG: phenylalanine--tRNA ligase subunit beta, partial [Candidatus Paceibacterota bacterium]